MTSLVCLVIANMIGAGVYTTSGWSLGALGTPQRVLLMWCIAGAIAIAGAICYGGLARQLVRSGGEYLFLSHAVHPMAGFMAGWISLLAGFTGAIAFSATTFVAYMPDGLGVESGLESNLLATGLIILCTIPHIWHTTRGSTSQNVLVIIKLCAIAIFLSVGFISIESHSEALAEPVSPTWSTYAYQLMWLSFSYSGFNASIYVAGEARLGRRTVRLSMLIATIGVTVIYLLLNYLFVYSAPLAEVTNQQDIAAISGRFLGGAPMEMAVRCLIALSLATGVSAMIQVGPRVYAKMAEDGMLPEWLASASNTPRAAIFAQAVLAILLVWMLQLREVLEYTSFMLSISAAATVACLLLPRFRGRPGSRPVPLWPVLPILFTGVTLLIAGLGCVHRFSTSIDTDGGSPKGFLLGCVVVLSGLVIYQFTPSQRAAREQQAGRDSE